MSAVDDVITAVLWPDSQVPCHERVLGSKSWCWLCAQTEVMLFVRLTSCVSMRNWLRSKLIFRIHLTMTLDNDAWQWHLTMTLDKRVPMIVQAWEQRLASQWRVSSMPCPQTYRSDQVFCQQHIYRVFFQVFSRWGRVKSDFFQWVKNEN